MLTKENLKGRWWYRLLIVAFIIGVIILVAFVVITALSEQPVLDAYTSTYQFKCNSDNVPRGHIAGSALDTWSGTPTVIDSNTDQIIRFFCTDPADNAAQETASSTVFNLAYQTAVAAGIIPTADNYVIVMKTPAYDGSWSDVAWYLVLGLLAVGVVGWIVKTIFMYILIGEKPQVPFRKWFRSRSAKKEGIEL